MSAEGPRLFVAIDLPAVARAPVLAEVDALRALGADLRWVPVEQLHLTLKFVGALEAGQVEPLCRALAALPRSGPLALELRGLGRFPPAGRGPARVVWAGVVGPGGEALVELAARVDRACAGCGVAREARAFTPHLTLGRVRSSRGLQPLEAAIAARGPAFTVPLPPIDALRLYRSELRPEGARHSVVAEFPLGDDRRP
jgi:2'-5' RNA ligase